MIDLFLDPTDDLELLVATRILSVGERRVTQVLRKSCERALEGTQLGDATRGVEQAFRRK